MQEILFPYKSIRPIQKAMILQVLAAIKNKQDIIAHAPTGIGKTAAVFSASIQHAISNNLTIFFLTPRHSQHHIAVETLRLINKKYNLSLKAVDFVGKKWMCPIAGADSLNSNEFSEYCRSLRENNNCEYFLNFREKTKRFICLKEIKSPSHVEEICAVCKKYKICPFEISCSLAKKANIIIADYFHILSPSIRDSLLLKTKKEIEKGIIIFDEAHNLPDKCRDLLTINLSTLIVDNAIRESKKFKLGHEKELEILKEKINILTKKIPLTENEILVKKDDFQANPDYAVKFEISAAFVREEQKKSFLGSIANFLKNWKGPDYGFLRIISRNFTRFGKPFTSLSYKCLDPSLIFKNINSYSKILMSGTLSPAEMYRDLLGLNTNAVLSEYYSPFPKQNRLNLIVPNTSTKFTQRDNNMYEKIAKICASIVNKIHGNCLLFFPSYQLRDNINVYFQNLCEKTTFLEQPRLNKKEKQELLENFKKYKNAVLLGTASGSLGEGIDLPGIIKAILIVGLPLAKPDLETRGLIEYYDQRFKKGWNYGYIYPAVIRSLQNAGRCIRSETDKGIIMFLDERYSWPVYRKCFPPELNIKITTKPLEEIEKFFG